MTLLGADKMDRRVMSSLRIGGYLLEAWLKDGRPILGQAEAQIAANSLLQFRCEIGLLARNPAEAIINTDLLPDIATQNALHGTEFQLSSYVENEIDVAVDYAEAWLQSIRQYRRKLLEAGIPDDYPYIP